MRVRRRARSTGSRRLGNARSTPSADAWHTSRTGSAGERRAEDMSLRFGTDGVRGVANSELTPEYVLALGRAAARVLDVDRLVIGRDTRASGPLLESALAAGAAAEGVNVELAGIVPTPAVAYLAGEGPGRAGAVISA